MTGKDLVPRPHNDVALSVLVVDEVPQWDAKVRLLITEISHWMRDREAFPDMKRKAIATRADLLEEMVFELENGRWPEGILSDRPGPEEFPTPPWADDSDMTVLDLLDDAVWDEVQTMDYGDRMKLLARIAPRR